MKRFFVLAVSLLLAPVHFAQTPASRSTTPTVQVGVLGLFHPREAIVTPRTGKSLVCAAGDQRLAVNDPITFTLNGQHIAIKNQPWQTATVHCDDGQGVDSEFVVSIPGKLARRYVGQLNIKASGTHLDVVVGMALETAVASVVAAESPPGAPLEALKAQAVAARSFLVAGRGRHRDFDFCDTTHCQFLRAPPHTQSPAAQATAATEGIVLTYQEKAFAAFYSSSCGGHTHSLQELGLPVRDYPYFAVPCFYCLRHPERWVSRIADADATDLAPTEQSRLELSRKLGWKILPGNSYASRHEDGSVILEGVGVGHGIGLCQRGAADMARNGASFLEILEHYYPNTALRRLP
jgi:stage II sporulation protein D